MSYKEAIQQNDMVNQPPHYNSSEIECIDVSRAATENGYEYYLQGVILKYLWRYRHKGKPIEDLKKAEWYLKRLISVMQNKNTEE